MNRKAGESVAVALDGEQPRGGELKPFPVPADAVLARRIGRVHLRQRLSMEAEHVDRVFGRGRTFFHIENWHSMHGFLRRALRVTGLYRRGLNNARALTTRVNDVPLEHLPAAFDGYTLLHITDLHLDMGPGFTDVLVDQLRSVGRYDACVMTGDFRALTHGPWEPAVDELARLMPHLSAPVYGVLGNHDSIRMVPALEAMGMRLLLNESVILQRQGARIHLAGIDDPHYFQAENFESAARDIPADAVAILLSHSPEPYRRAAHTGFDLMLSGHTHGGQICLPGGVPLITNASCPRRYCAGPWRHGPLQGYTSTGSGASAVEVRFNCPPEITLHRLWAA